MRVIYIAGHARSGSTLLEALLTQRIPCLGLGELAHLMDPSPPQCQCGKPTSECPFWSRIVERALGGIGTDMADAKSGARRAERAWPATGRKKKEAVVRAWAEIFEGVAHETGAAVIVDNSKTLAGSRFRPLILASAPNVELEILEVIRDPRAVTYSAVTSRGGRHGKDRRNRWLFHVRAPLGWMTTMIMTPAIYSVFKLERRLVVYDELVASVSNDQYWTDLGIDAQVAPASDFGHSLGGNVGVAFGLNGQDVRRDERWRQSRAIRRNPMVMFSLLLYRARLALRPDDRVGDDA